MGLKYVSGEQGMEQAWETRTSVTYSWVKGIANDLSLHDESLPWELSTTP